MPDIPNVPGVPALSSYGAQDVILLTADFVTAALGLPPIWGVFLDGLPVFPITSMITFEYKQDWALANYPIEGGQFQTYDKVQLPFDVRVRIASGPSTFERQFLLKEVDIAANSLALFDVITPERVFTDCNITHYDYARRATNGVGMILVDIWFQQIRETFASVLQNALTPVLSGQVGVGSVEPQAVNESAPSVGEFT